MYKQRFKTRFGTTKTLRFHSGGSKVHQMKDLLGAFKAVRNVNKNYLKGGSFSGTY